MQTNGQTNVNGHAGAKGEALEKLLARLLGLPSKQDIDQFDKGVRTAEEMLKDTIEDFLGTEYMSTVDRNKVSQVGAALSMITIQLDKKFPGFVGKISECLLLYVLKEEARHQAEKRRDLRM